MLLDDDDDDRPNEEAEKFTSLGSIGNLDASKLLPYCTPMKTKLSGGKVRTTSS
jgi:hypothetical protein